MEAFLKQVSKDLYQRYGDNISEVAMVFPGKRVSLFFLKHLSQITQKPIWAPKCYTILELMETISGTKAGDPLQLIVELYDVYSKVTKTKESFDDFYFWGEMLLADFNDIDKYLVNAADLFQNLSLLKTYENLYNYLTDDQITSIKEFWGTIKDNPEKDIQKKFLDVWSALFPVYERFKAALKKTGLMYEGMIYRDVAEKMMHKGSLDIPVKKLVFIGFNALNSSERLLFEHLKIHGKADFYWDYDQSYIEDNVHQAGFFLKGNIKGFPPPETFHLKNRPSGEVTIRVKAIGSDIAQAKLAGISLEPLSLSNEINEETALILADESLLPQVLYSLPQALEEVNITMGYPVVLSQVYSFLDTVFNLHHYSRRHGNDVFFYFQQVNQLLQHPFVLKTYRVQVDHFIQQVKEKDMVYVPYQSIPDIGPLKGIFSLSSGVFNWINEILLSVIGILRSVPEKSPNDRLEMEFLFHVYAVLNRLEEIIHKKGLEVNMQTMRRMIRRVIKNMRVPFSGEPLKGLQIMGLLETRAIDFKNIIILSFNEGIYPKSSASPSYIPYNLRKGFGLPTLEHQDSIFAYYFYRLLQRAETVDVYYNSSPDGLKTGERSRFLHQLAYQNDQPVNESAVTIPLSNHSPLGIEIKQSFETTQLLKKFQHGKGHFLSPSALNIYLDCSLKFYFKYIANVPEEDQVSEEVDPAIFGNILHDSMEQLYMDVANKKIDERVIRHFLDNENIIHDIINTCFINNYAGQNQLISASGSNIIVKNVILTYIRQILNVDLRRVPFEIVEMEQKHERAVPVSSNPEVNQIVIGGKIDRVDKSEDKLQVIDYKTGKAAHAYKNLEELFGRGDFNRNKAAFQTFLYSYLYVDGQSKVIQPWLYPVKNMFEEGFDARIHYKDKQKTVFIEDFNTLREDFEKLLFNLTDEIYSPEAVFKQTDELRFCGQCPYKNICRK